ncbi:MAG TPA: hypothetical protein VH678_23115 [Xanthobacteraceae bacterium]|jgi:hypothetical protein
MLLLPAIWNGFPLLEYDTGGYLARWFEGYLVPSRPAAYGLLLAPAARLDFWPVVVLQAAATIWILLLLLRELGIPFRSALLAAVVATLTFTTTLPWLASILLTDIFAGLAVLALYLIVLGRTVGTGQRWALVGFTGFAAASHSATLALVIILGCFLALLPRRLVCWSRAGCALVSVALAVAMTLSANRVVSGRFEFTPGGYGILFGRMLEDGIVARYLRDHCPDSRFRLCGFRDQLPATADEFLWSDGVFNRLGRFDGLGEEMRSIVLDSLRDYPFLQIKTAVAGTIMQLTRVGTGEGVVNTLWHTYGIIDRYTPAAGASMRAARQQRGEIRFNGINALHIPIALGAMTLLPLLMAAGLKWSRFAQLSLLACIIAIALLGNAFVCGALANPHDRYGARLTWLAPLAVLLGAIRMSGLPDEVIPRAAVRSATRGKFQQ